MIPKIKILKKNEKMPADIILSYIHVHHKWRSYGIWFLKFKVQQTEIFVIFGPFFALSAPLTTWKSKILTLKKTLQDIIISHICTINDNHMMFGSWDMECSRQIFLSFWTVVWPFTPYVPRKLKFLKNEKKTTRYYRKILLFFLIYGVQQTEFFVILDRFSPLTSPPLTIQKIKNGWRYYHLTYSQIR